MDTEVLTSVEELRKEVAEIRKLGKRWGFEDDEIDACVTEVLGAENTHVSSPKKPPKGKFRKCLRFGFRAMIGFWSVITVLYIVTSCLDEKTMAPIVKPLMALSYPVLRYSRLLSLPLHDIYNLSEYYHAECLVQNPWFDDSPDSCWHCRNKKKMAEISAKSTVVFRQELEAAVFRESIPTAHGFSSFQQMFEENKSILQAEFRATTVASNRPEFRSLGDIFQKENTKETIINDQGFTFTWHTITSLLVNRMIRQFLGKPKFLGSASETSFHKTIVIQGPGTKPYTLPFQHDPNGWYVQVEGERRVRATPTSTCREQCRTLETQLKARDAVVFTTASWTIELLPFEEKIVSIGYMGNFV